MTTNNEDPADQSDYRPDFELPRHGTIREDNWLEYEALGFRPVPEPLGWAQSWYGVEHVYTGDTYDYREGRPLRHMSGQGVYVDPEGLAHGVESLAKWKAWHANRPERQEPSGGGPGAS
jgi:hypothetical protein